MRFLNIVLGTGKPYHLMLFGGNLTTSVTYSGGSLIDMAGFEYDATGNLTFTFLEDVEFSQKGLEVSILNSADLVTLNVTLPAGLHGALHCYEYTTAYVVLGPTWFWRGMGNYSTDNGEYDPSLWMYVGSHNLVAYLS